MTDGAQHRTPIQRTTCTGSSRSFTVMRSPWELATCHRAGSLRGTVSTGAHGRSGPRVDIHRCAQMCVCRWPCSTRASLGLAAPQACFLGSPPSAAAAGQAPGGVLARGCAPRTEQACRHDHGAKGHGTRMASPGVVRQRPLVAAVHTGGAAEGTVASPLPPPPRCGPLGCPAPGPRTGNIKGTLGPGVGPYLPGDPPQPPGPAQDRAPHTGCTVFNALGSSHCRAAQLAPGARGPLGL